MTAYVFDTNVISILLKLDADVYPRYQKVYVEGHTIIACPLVYYESKRGLFARDAKVQMRAFEALIAMFEWQDFSRQDWVLASDLWAQRRAMGRPGP